jgi:hypothetical protein
VDTFQHGLSLLDAAETWAAQSQSGFGSEYRRQLEVRSVPSRGTWVRQAPRSHALYIPNPLPHGQSFHSCLNPDGSQGGGLSQEAMQVNADTNKVRKRLEKVQELNTAIQQGTHDGALTKEGSVASAYQQWLEDNADRLQRVRARHRSGQQAAAAAATAALPSPPDVVATAPAAPQQPVISEEDLAEMLTCHRYISVCEITLALPSRWGIHSACPVEATSSTVGERRCRFQACLRD